MISETERYHGMVFSRIARNISSLSLRQYNSKSTSSYVVNGTGLFIKYSTKRMSPWHFTFIKQHQDEIEEMKKNLNDVVVALVCGSDGIASLSSVELNKVLDDNHAEIERITVSRPPRGKYRIGGTDGKLSKAIGDNEFPGKLFK